MNLWSLRRGEMTRTRYPTPAQEGVATIASRGDQAGPSGRAGDSASEPGQDRPATNPFTPSRMERPKEG